MAAGVNVHSAWALIIACGKNEEVAPGVEAAFLNMGDQPVLAYSLAACQACPDVEGIVVVSTKDRMDSVVGMARLFGAPKLKKIVVGGVQRTASIKAGLSALQDCGASLVVLHDAAVPNADTALIQDVIKSAKRYGVAVAARRVAVPMACVPKGLKVGSVMPAGTCWRLETPVAAKLPALEAALEKGKKAGRSDDDKFAEHLFEDAYLVPATQPLIRISSMQDLQMAAAAIKG